MDDRKTTIEYLKSLYLENVDSFPTETYLQQKEVERRILKEERELIERPVRLKEEEHLTFLHQSLKQLPKSYQALDASQPWLCYWIIHSLDILKDKPTTEEYEGVLQHLSCCQVASGGFGGGFGQIAHLATTYAAVAALCILGTPEALNIIKLDKLYNWMLSLKNSDGSFRVTEQGESDIRGLYCALAVSYICNIMTDELIENCASFISSLQSFDGSLGGEPYNEGHGGYSYCGFAALWILDDYWRKKYGRPVPHTLDISRLQFWVSRRQLALEGGFQGRINKLVDSCYSFWQGGLVMLLSQWMKRNDTQQQLTFQFVGESLERYLLHYCQCAGGGFRDKPGKPRDLYHTCYSLSGLSLSHQMRSDTSCRSPSLSTINCLMNICENRFHFAQNYFSKTRRMEKE
eukprot:jgi/Galph1/4474/GphlegSOOS_G3178.1